MLGWLDGEASSLHGVACRFESYTEYQTWVDKAGGSEQTVCKTVPFEGVVQVHIRPPNEAVVMKKFTGMADVKRSLDNRTAVIKTVGFDLYIRVCWTLPFVRIRLNRVRHVRRI